MFSMWHVGLGLVVFETTTKGYSSLWLWETSVSWTTAREERKEWKWICFLCEWRALFIVWLFIDWLFGWLAGLVLEAGKTQGYITIKNFKKTTTRNTKNWENKRRKGGLGVCQNTLFTPPGTDLSCVLKCSLHSPSPCTGTLELGITGFNLVDGSSPWEGLKGKGRETTGKKGGKGFGEGKQPNDYLSSIPGTHGKKRGLTSRSCPLSSTQTTECTPHPQTW